MLRVIRTYSFPQIPVSWLPLASSILFGTVAMTLLTWLRGSHAWLGLTFSIVGFIALLVVWMRSLIQEQSISGNGSWMMNYALALGILLFILSELAVFFGFFWGWFTFALVPDLSWITYDLLSPYGAYYMDIGFATLNTMLLTSSGLACTASQMSLRAGYLDATVFLLALGVTLAALFTGVQIMEYADNLFDISTGTYGTCFYVLTGLHGLHVQIGTLLLIISMLRIASGNISHHGHTFVLGALFYWHFVDVVWIFLYLVVYLGANG